MFCNLDKYIWLFGQINLDWFMWLMHRERHIFVNIGMHVLENLGEAEGGRLVIWTNMFSNLDKYILVVGEIQLPREDLAAPPLIQAG